MACLLCRAGYISLRFWAKHVNIIENTWGARFVDFRIPAYILNLMDKLEHAGFQAWAVGGCVRDRLCGLEPHDWDLCTDALPWQTAEVFSDHGLVRSGEKHGTIAVIVDHKAVEITTFRREGGYDDARHPGWVEFVPDIARDLARRDFTVNAMAYCPRRGLADPWGGQADLKARVLRAVGDPACRFLEDGLRILRGIRFAARFGLKPEEKTLEAMVDLAHTLTLQARERVYTELCGFLTAADLPDLLTFRPVLFAAIPALAPMDGFRQCNPHHRYDVYTHTAHVVAAVPPRLQLRWAALLHDIAKPETFTLDPQGVGHFYNHAHLGREKAGEILLSLRAPTALRQQVETLIAYHGACRDLCRNTTDKSLRRLLLRLGEDTLRDLLALDRADDGGKGTPASPEVFDRFEARLNEVLAQAPCRCVRDLAIDGRDLMAQGIPQGPAIGRILTRLLEEVTDGTLENETAALQSRAAVLGADQP